MSAAKPTQAQVRRTVKGVLEAGFPIGAVEVTRDGTIRVLSDRGDEVLDEYPRSGQMVRPKQW